MSTVKIGAFILALIVTLFNWFPESEWISKLYGNIYDYSEVFQTLETAVRAKDSQAISEMASPKMKGKFPDLKERTDALFSDIEGDVLSVKGEEKRHSGESDFVFDIKTTESDYSIHILYTAVDAESEHKELGIRRMMLMLRTDEYYSWWVNPEHYMSADVMDQTDWTVTRRWRCGKGVSSDSYIFTVEEDYVRLADYHNVSVHVDRNNGYGVPDSGYALREEDEVRVYFIPEGETPPDLGKGNPDFTATGDFGWNGDCFLKPGRYYLYVEPSDNEMYYSVNVTTRL